MDAPMRRFYGFLIFVVILLVVMMFSLSSISRNVGYATSKDVPKIPFQQCTMMCNVLEQGEETPTIVPSDAFISPENVIMFDVIYPPTITKDVRFTLEDGLLHCSITDDGQLLAKSAGTCTVQADIYDVTDERVMTLYAKVTVE